MATFGYNQLQLATIASRPWQPQNNFFLFFGFNRVQKLRRTFTRISRSHANFWFVPVCIWFVFPLGGLIWSNSTARSKGGHALSLWGLPYRPPPPPPPPRLRRRAMVGRPAIVNMRQRSQRLVITAVRDRPRLLPQDVMSKNATCLTRRPATGWQAMGILSWVRLKKKGSHYRNRYSS